MLVGAVITLNVALGGMKGITLVQAFQYWVKMFAISVPIFVLMAVYGHYGKQLGIELGNRRTRIDRRASNSRADPVGDTCGRSVQRLAAAGKSARRMQTWIAPFGPLTTKAAKAAGSVGTRNPKPYSLLYTYSLIIALVCGTAGLPHILVRFYTNPDGVAAKRTTMWVMILIGVFYVFPPVFGVMGRNLMPELYNGLSGRRKARTRSCSNCRRSCSERVSASLGLDPQRHHLRRRVRRLHEHVQRIARLA